MVTPRRYAQLKGVAYTTVMNWLQHGKIPEAVKHTTPTGHYWELPASAPAPRTQAGRPKTKKTAAPAKATHGRRKAA